jgi:hypothetical protein
MVGGTVPPAWQGVITSSGNPSQPPDGGAARLDAHGDRVDARRAGVETICRGAHAPALLVGQLEERVVPHPGLHLDGDEPPVEPEQQIDLASTGSHVAPGEARPASPEEGERRLLPEAP